MLHAALEFLCHPNQPQGVARSRLCSLQVTQKMRIAVFDLPQALAGGTGAHSQKNGVRNRGWHSVLLQFEQSRTAGSSPARAECNPGVVAAEWSADRAKNLPAPGDVTPSLNYRYPDSLAAVARVCDVMARFRQQLTRSRIISQRTPALPPPGCSSLPRGCSEFVRAGRGMSLPAVTIVPG